MRIFINRFCAFIIDHFIFLFVLVTIFHFVTILAKLVFHLPANSSALTTRMLLSTIIIYPCYFSLFSFFTKTTPAKFIFGIKRSSRNNYYSLFLREILKEFGIVSIIGMLIIGIQILLQEKAYYDIATQIDYTHERHNFPSYTQLRYNLSLKKYKIAISSLLLPILPLIGYLFILYFVFTLVKARYEFNQYIKSKNLSYYYECNYNKTIDSTSHNKAYALHSLLLVRAAPNRGLYRDFA